MTRSEELRAVAERVAAVLPPVVTDVVLTGSTSRGVADEHSDVGEAIVNGIPLRGDRHAAWQAQLGRYPPGLNDEWPTGWKRLDAVVRARQRLAEAL